MNISLCVKCGSSAAFPKAVKEPYTCITCQRAEQSRPPTTGEAKAIVSSELVLLLRQKLEDLSKQARDKMDAAAAREEYGKAQYYRGQEHALALASLRVKNLEQQNNAI